MDSDRLIGTKWIRRNSNETVIIKFLELDLLWTIVVFDYYGVTNKLEWRIFNDCYVNCDEDKKATVTQIYISDSKPPLMTRDK